MRSASSDVLEMAFDLDNRGHRVEVKVEFFADGSAAVEWTALDLPIPLPYVMCMVHEVDLIGSLVPYIHNASTLHEFPWNPVDRVIRIVTKPPIPFVKGFEAVAQRFGFDLLDTPWGGLCMVEMGPKWKERGTGAGGANWRGLPKPPMYQAGLKEIDVHTVIALGRPCGPKGEWTTVLFSAKANLGVPRSLLPNWLLTWLIKLIARFVFQHAVDHVAKFDKTDHGARLQGPSKAFYAELWRRVRQAVEAQTPNK